MLKNNVQQSSIIGMHSFIRDIPLQKKTTHRLRPSIVLDTSNSCFTMCFPLICGDVFPDLQLKSFSFVLAFLVMDMVTYFFMCRQFSARSRNILANLSPNLSQIRASLKSLQTHLAVDNIMLKGFSRVCRAVRCLFDQESLLKKEPKQTNKLEHGLQKAVLFRAHRRVGVGWGMY